MSLARKSVFSIALILIAVTSAAAGSTEDAARLYADGKALLAKGNFEGALNAYQAAAKTDPEELNYEVRAAILQRVMNLRGSLGKLEGGPKWQPAVRALHAYYLDNHVYSEALDLGKKLHARQESEASAVLLARTQLAVNDNAAAMQTLNGLTPAITTPEAHVLLGVALARQGESDKARLCAGRATNADPADARLLFDLSRLQTLLGNLDEAQRALVGCFENTPPSRLGSIKTAARDSVDLAALRGSAGFTAALETKSKVAESECSSGASCGSCPSRESCGSEDAKKKDKP